MGNVELYLINLQKVCWTESDRVFVPRITLQKLYLKLKPTAENAQQPQSRTESKHIMIKK